MISSRVWRSTSHIRLSIAFHSMDGSEIAQSPFNQSTPLDGETEDILTLLISRSP